jgi:hypothetical protein
LSEWQTPATAIFTNTSPAWRVEGDLLDLPVPSDTANDSAPTFHADPDELITRRYRLDQINEAITDMSEGRNIRGIIEFD